MITKYLGSNLCSSTVFLPLNTWPLECRFSSSGRWGGKTSGKRKQENGNGKVVGK